MQWNLAWILVDARLNKQNENSRIIKLLFLKHKIFLMINIGLRFVQVVTVVSTPQINIGENFCLFLKFTNINNS